MSTISTTPQYRHEPARDLGVTEACAALGLHSLSIRRYIASGRLYAYKLGNGRNWLIPADAIRDFIAGEAISVDPLAEHVAAVVAAAPELTTEQRDKLAGLLRSTAGSDSR